MCRCLSGKLHIDFSLPGWLGNEMNAMIYGQFPGGNDSFRYFVCFVLLFRLYFQLSLSVCNFDATSDSKAQHENLFGSHLSSADTYSHAHTHTTASPPHTHIAMAAPHGTLLIVLVAPAISCQINFNLIKFFHFTQSQ